MDHLAGAVGAHNRGRTSGYMQCRRGIRGRFDGLRAGGLYLCFDTGEEVALYGMEQAVGSHLHEARRQHMLEEAPDACHHWNAHPTRKPIHIRPLHVQRATRKPVRVVFEE